ncbi:MAG TPA: tetratricopeptide repeat protein [Bacteroides sp.]|nr:tetratricopeptide repeat protein [Bacteroides sp.]
MDGDSNKISRFWQELKRRKVFRVIAMYAGVAYIIIELVSNVAEPLHLPEWTATLVILLLAIGFPIVAVLSWIFDVTPEGLKKTGPARGAGKQKIQTSKRRIKVSNGIIAALVVVVCILLYPKIFKPDRLEQLRSKGEISVAVMPFHNRSGDKSKDFWQEMIQDNLVNSLSNAEPLKVRQTESVTALLQNAEVKNYAAITPAVAGHVSQKLDASVFVQGSVNQAGQTVRLNAKLIDSKTEEVFQSFQIDGSPEDILYLTDSLSLMVKDYLVVSILKMEAQPDLRFAITARSPEAMRYALDGTTAFKDLNFEAAREMWHKAMEIDSNYFGILIHMAYAFGNQGYIEEARQWALKAYNRKDDMTRMEKLYADIIYARYLGTPQDVIKGYRQALELDDQQANLLYNLGRQHNRIHQFEKAIPVFEKALEIYDKWGIKPFWVYNYTLLGDAYHQLGLYRKEKRLYRKAEKDFPDDRLLIYNQALLAFSRGREEKASEFIDRFVTLCKESLFSEAETAFWLGSLYWDAQRIDQAESYFRKTLELEPGDPETMNNMAFFLVETGRNLDEALELVDRALVLNPENYNYLDTKGWVLYKQGKKREALELLEKSWELKPVYNHEIYLHLEEVRKAVAGEPESQPN